MLSLLLLASCNKKAKGEDVMATVNGKDILRSDVDKYYKEQTADNPQKPTTEEAESLRLAILQQLVQNQLMLQRAEKLGLMATDDEVDRKLSEMKAPYTTEQWQKELKDRGLSEDEMKRELRRNLTIDKLLNKEVTSKISISDNDISSYYNANKAQFNLIEPQYHIAHLWVSPHADEVNNLRNDKAQNDAEAKKKIATLRNRVASGEDFATLAMNYSEDPRTSANGGDLGLIPESSLQRTDAATRAAVLKLKPGEVSDVITVVNPSNGQVEGYRIVKLLAKEPAGQRELSDPRVQQSIREMLRQRREQLLKAAYYEVLQNQAKVENFYAQDILKKSGS